MIVPDSFAKTLKNIDRGLFARWENWKPDRKDGTCHIWPMVGDPKRMKVESIPSYGRFVIYHTARSGRVYSIFDVVYPDGSYHPLDNRVLRGIMLRDGSLGAWHELDKRTRAYLDATRKVTIPKEAEGPLHDAFEAYFRENVGLRQFALGSTSAPAARNSGHYVVVDKRRRFEDGLV